MLDLGQVFAAKGGDEVPLDVSQGSAEIVSIPTQLDIFLEAQEEL
jgi:hypothetical protein